MLMPSSSLTNILWSNWSYQEKPTIPQIGECTRNYKSDSETGLTTHSSDGDWVVTRVEKFISPDTGKQIFVCYCKHAPIQSQWNLVNRGAIASELLESKAEF